MSADFGTVVGDVLFSAVTFEAVAFRGVAMDAAVATRCGPAIRLVSVDIVAVPGRGKRRSSNGASLRSPPYDRCRATWAAACVVTGITSPLPPERVLRAR